MKAGSWGGVSDKMTMKKAGDWAGIAHKCQCDAKPPVVPKLFANMLDEKTFTKESDRALAKRKYREAFFALVGSREVLSFVGLNCGPNDAKGLAPVLNMCTWLRELDLGDNRIGNKGVDHLAASFGRLDTVEVLCLHNNSIGDEGAVCLATALPKMTKLRQLVLFSNSIRHTVSKR